jgi:S-adenosylmethionine:diacylglycerol 3-amino-3-carboxypropyl transferase
MIYYSHINEDNRVERELLKTSNCQSVVAICGSGERVISLLDDEKCEKVLVVDCNEEELFLLQLKLAALRVLPVKEYLSFIGHYSSTAKQRLVQYQQARSYLHKAAVNFWDHHQQFIKAGILNAGYFERFLKRIRPLLNFCLGRNSRHVFEDGYNMDSFPVRRWELLKKLFSIRFIYKLAGNRDPAFVGENADTGLIPEALDDSFKTGKAAASFMSHLVFKGSLRQMDQTHFPPSLREDVLSRIKYRLLRGGLNVQYYHSDLLEFLRDLPVSNSKVFYSLSDLLSFTDFHYLQQVLAIIGNHGNLMVSRSFLRNRLNSRQLEEISQYGQLEQHPDSTGMYQVVSIQSQMVCQ